MIDLADVQLIGVDGGATEVKAHAVAVEPGADPPAYRLRDESAARVYPVEAGFEPVPIAEQLAARDAGGIEPTAAERSQGRRWVEAAAEAIVEVARACRAKRVLVGVGMPGLKTPDGRGIAVINNGPRIPDYLDRLEAQLADAGVELGGPIAELGSDADYCGLGEEYAADGLFRDVEHAYYAGCGTGIADALKLRGELVPFDAARDWIMKAWQIPSALGPTFEKLVSAKALNAVYARLLTAAGRQGHCGTGLQPVKGQPGAAGPQEKSRAASRAATVKERFTGQPGAAGPQGGKEEGAKGRRDEGHPHPRVARASRPWSAGQAGEDAEDRPPCGPPCQGGQSPGQPRAAGPQQEDGRPGFPERRAAAGEPVASGWMGAVALVLAELVFERLDTIRHGRAAAPHRGSAYARLQREHPYRGIVLDRVVIGQRLGQMYADPGLRGVLADDFERYLAALIATLGDEMMTRAYLADDGRLRPGFVRASKLRAAPALGAAVAAVAAARG